MTLRLAEEPAEDRVQPEEGAVRGAVGHAISRQNPLDLPYTRVVIMVYDRAATTAHKDITQRLEVLPPLLRVELDFHRVLGRGVNLAFDIIKRE